MGKRRKDTVLTPEWSHRIDATAIGKELGKIHIEASAQECKDLSRRLKVVAIDGLKADMTTQRVPDRNIIHVTGRLMATVTQSCVVTGELVTERIEEMFEAWYNDEEQVISLTKVKRDRQSMLLDSELPVPDEKDDPEQIVDGQIDLGELATQYLSLGINPYPRKEGTALDKTDENEAVLVASSGPRKNPFAALKDWKLKKDSEK